MSSTASVLYYGITGVLAALAAVYFVYLGLRALIKQQPVLFRRRWFVVLFPLSVLVPELGIGISNLPVVC